MNKKTLVVYFSATGTTARAAREIAEAASPGPNRVSALMRPARRGRKERFSIPEPPHGRSAF